MDSIPYFSSPNADPAESKQFLQGLLSLLSQHGVAVWSYDPVTGDMCYESNVFEVLGLGGYCSACSNLEHRFESMNPQDVTAYKAALAQVDAAGEKGVTIRYQNTTAEGDQVWLEDHLKKITNTRVVCYTRNINAEELQKQQADETFEKYRKLVNTLPNFVFVFDQDFIFRDIIMPDGMSLLHPREELIGTSGSKIFTPEVTELYTNNIRECLHTGQMKEIEYFLMIGEVKYYFQARIVPFEDNKVFALISDIGDRVKRMENLVQARKRAEMADKMKSAFLANMSHEIRTPLNAIVGFTEVIANEEDPAIRAEYMDIIRTNNNLLLQLINDILDISRIESGKVEMNFANTEMNTLIDEVDQTNRMRIKPGVKFIVERPQGEIWVLTDHNRVMQVLSNFLSNAAKNTDEGSITLKLDVEDNNLRFSVKDTGRGIPKDKLGTIFQRFEKVNDFVQGTGLGLAICQTLVERLGGHIMVESTLGKGSTFSFTLPYRNTAAIDSGTGQSSSPSGKKQVLIAEVFEEDFNMMKEVLTKAYDVDVLWAQDGEQALSLFYTAQPSLVLVNIQLPLISGIDVVKRIRSVSLTVPIVGLTTSSFYMEQQWAQEAGCNDILSKPFSATKLEEVVLAFL